MAAKAIQIRLHQCAKTFAHGRGAVMHALHPTDLTVQAGETLVLLGPSGCGKTTTLRLIAGLEFTEPGGQIFFDETDVTHLPIEARGVGMVFQQYALFPNMTVAQNIGYGLRVRRLAKTVIAERVASVARMVELEPLLSRRIDQLSGGQRQRVALARAIAVEPRVLLFDEPLTALDAKLRESLRADLVDLLARLAITAVYVTHDQTEAMALGDRIAVMRAGRIEQIDVPQAIYHRPMSPFVADFIGRLNRVPARATDTRLQLPGGSIEDAEHRFAGSTLMFRPEDVRVVRAAGPWCGQIASLAFLGERTMVAVVLPDGTVIHAEASSRFDVPVGEQVSLDLAPGAWFSDADWNAKE